MNILILFIEIVVVFGVLLLSKKLFGKVGVISWVGIATVLANIITAKNANIGGLSVAIGTVLFASTFLATDILSECYTNEAHVLDSVLKEKYRVSYNLGNISMEKLYCRWPVDSIEVVKVDTTNSKCQQLFSRKPELRGHFKYSLIYKTHPFTGKDTLTLVCCHLESSHIHGDSLSVSDYKSALDDAYTIRDLEADAIYESLSKEAYPMIVMGDLNDISSSYALRRIQSLGLYDAWWKGGAGYGRTFHEGYINFRLDHILYSKDFFSLKRVNVVDDDKSDHNALTASFRFKNKVND
jgi:hypothetical protein